MIILNLYITQKSVKFRSYGGEKAKIISAFGTPRFNHSVAIPTSVQSASI